MAEVLNIWSGWPRIVEIAGNAFLFYALIIVMVRMVGKRTTSELNNFDWIINVMIGSLAASGVLLRNVATADAIAAIVVLAACQYITTKLVQRSRTIANIVKAEPTLLTHKGEYLRDAMLRTRIPKKRSRPRCGRTGSRTTPMPTGSCWRPMASCRSSRGRTSRGPKPRRCPMSTLRKN